MKQAMQMGGLPPSSQAEVVRVAPDHPADAQAAGEAAAAGEVTVAKDARQIRFLKGTVMGVDCSSAPAAVMTVVSGAKTWKMKVGDSNHVVVIGADKFSCGWSQQKVAVNYHETGSGEGIVVSVEIE